MTEKERARLEARHRTYEGFGDRRSAATWARLAGIPRTSFWRYLQAGMTVEEIFELRGATYKAESPKPGTRKPRYSAKMTETRMMLYRLLTVSGYILNEGPECIDVKPLQNKQHAITFHGRPFGSYNYKTGILLLSRGEYIPINELDWATTRVLRNSYGFWEPHPQTRQEVSKWAVKKQAEKKQTRVHTK